jgi:hypothetical protein
MKSLFMSHPLSTMLAVDVRRQGTNRSTQASAVLCREREWRERRSGNRLFVYKPILWPVRAATTVAALRLVGPAAGPRPLSPGNEDRRALSRRR